MIIDNITTTPKLRPRHRVGDTHWLDTGVPLPFGQPVDSLNKPNRFVYRLTCLRRRDGTDQYTLFGRLLYSEDAEWLLMDNTSPVFAWDSPEVEETRKQKDCPMKITLETSSDLFRVFPHQAATRGVYLPSSAIHPLRSFLLGGPQHLPGAARLGDARKTKPMFDRVETSNAMDTRGPSSIISARGPRLNRKNLTPHCSCTR